MSHLKIKVYKLGCHRCPFGRLVLIAFEVLFNVLPETAVVVSVPTDKDPARIRDEEFELTYQLNISKHLKLLHGFGVSCRLPHRRSISWMCPGWKRVLVATEPRKQTSPGWTFPLLDRSIPVNKQNRI